MKLGHIEILVADPLHSRVFYEELLGFEVVAVQHERFVWLKLRDRELLLRAGVPPTAGDSYPSAGIALVFYTDDLAAFAEKCRRKGITTQCDGADEDCITLQDPDGHWLQAVDPRDHQ
ncbi:MAG TPA: VOC family protein [Capsulimonadaceae bacterium]|nr:VOC family protein [Capsulimonadaceae bacterium]